MISQGIELDNISLHYLMKVKEKVNYSTLHKLPTHRVNRLDPGKFVPKVGLDDIARSFDRQPRYIYISNTLELISDVVFLYQLDKSIDDYLGLKLQTSISASEASSKS